MNAVAAIKRRATEPGKACGAAAALLVLLLGFAPRVGAQSEVGSGTTEASSQRNSFRDNNGRFWVFYNNGSEFVYRSGTDGQNWSASEQSVFDPGTYPHAGSQGAIWYDKNEGANGKVYVIVSNKDGTSCYVISCDSGNMQDVYIQSGEPQANGTITWKPTAGTVAFGRPSTEYVHDGPGSVNISKHDALGSNNVRIGVTLQYTLGAKYAFFASVGNSSNLSFTGASTMYACNTFSNQRPFSVLVPDSPTTFYVFHKQPSATIGMYRSWRYLDTPSSAGGSITNNMANWMNGQQSDAFTHAAVAEPAEGTQYNVHYLAMVGSPAYPTYRRRNAGAGGAWQTAVNIDSVRQDQRNPSIAWVEGTPDAIYAVYTDSGPNYSIYMTSAIAPNYNGWSNPVVVATGTAGLSFDYPSLAMYGVRPKRLPLVYTGSDGNVYFDSLVTSTFPDPVFDTVEANASGGLAEVGAAFSGDLLLSRAGAPDAGFLDPATYGAILAEINFGVSQDPNIAIASTTRKTSDLLHVSITLPDNIPFGDRAMRVINGDGRKSLYRSPAFTVVVPAADIFYPIGAPTSFYTTVPDINGTATKTPGGASLALNNTQVRITLLDDPVGGLTGAHWNGSAFELGLPAAQQWKNATGGASWIYNGWPDEGDNQKNNYKYRIEARGTTADGGYGEAGAAQDFVVDKAGPNWTILTPDVQQFKNTSPNVKVSASDGASGIKNVQGMIRRPGADGNFDPLTALVDDIFWDPTAAACAGAWTAPGVEKWFEAETDQGNSPLGSPQGTLTIDVDPFADPCYNRPGWVNGNRYQVNVRGQDDLLQMTTGTARQFVYDITPPAITLDIPAQWTGDGDWLNGAAVIGGQSPTGVTDNVVDPGNFRKVYMTIEQSGAFWDWLDNEWAGVPQLKVSTYSTTGTGWSFDTSNVQFTNGATYIVHLWAADQAGNTLGTPGDTGDTAITRSFLYDENPPVSRITYPITGALPNAYGYDTGKTEPSLALMGGTAEDGVGESAIATVEFALHDESESLYWCFIAQAPSECWQGDGLINPSATPLWMTATSTDVPVQWKTYGISGLDWGALEGASMKLQVRTIDVAGNIQNVYVSSIPFLYDSQTPNTSVSVPCDVQSGLAEGNPCTPPFTYMEGIPSINGNSSDQPPGNNAGISVLNVGFSRDSDGKVWKWPGGWVDAGSRIDHPVSLASLPAWSLNIDVDFFNQSPSPNTFNIIAYAADQVTKPNATFRNTEPSTLGDIDVSFNYEIDAPVSSITVPSPGFPLNGLH
ncbi:MAG: hypothetical protein ABIJ96_11610, partial [Elusimicrobiota bacterium]